MGDIAQGAHGTWFVVHNMVTGVLDSEGDRTAPSDVLSALGFTAVQLDHRPDPLVERWDPVTRALVPTTQPVQPFQVPPVSSVFTFVSYDVLDAGLSLNFFGPLANGKRGNTTILFTDTELAALSNQALVLNAVQAKLLRKVRAVGFASKLDPLIGQTVTI